MELVASFMREFPAYRLEHVLGLPVHALAELVAAAGRNAARADRAVRESMGPPGGARGGRTITGGPGLLTGLLNGKGR